MSNVNFEFVLVLLEQGSFIGVLGCSASGTAVQGVSKHTMHRMLLSFPLCLVVWLSVYLSLSLSRI